MNCAIELLTINANAMEEKERKEKEEAARRAKAVYENTIEFCNGELNDLLVACAKRGKRGIRITFPMRFDRDHEEFILIRVAASRRGRRYYESYGGWMNTKVFRDYLQAHCLNVKFEREPYPCWNGGNYIDSHDCYVFVDA